MKNSVGNSTFLGRVWFKLARKLGIKKFSGSANYWEGRYARGGDSGSGSYNRLAEFKAEVLNDFVARNDIRSVLEFGSGDGNQVSLAQYPHYIGIDVSQTIVNKCNERYADDPTKEFFKYDKDYLESNREKFLSDLTLSLDVIFHLVEEEVFQEYMKNLFSFSKKYVIVYASNFNSKDNFHERDWKFTDWVDAHAKDWKLIQKIDNRYPLDPTDLDNTSKSDFFIFAKG